MNPRLISAVALVALLGSTQLSFAVDSGGASARVSVNDQLSTARDQIKSQKWDAAIGTLRLALEAEPNNADTRSLMGDSLRKSGNMQRAEGFYLKALKLSPKHRGANEYLGELYVEIGQLDKAKQRLDSLKGICGTGCDEYKDLKAAIDKAS